MTTLTVACDSGGGAIRKSHGRLAFKLCKVIVSFNIRYELLHGLCVVCRTLYWANIGTIILQETKSKDKTLHKFLVGSSIYTEASENGK